jgi:hypothetical protein
VCHGFILFINKRYRILDDNSMRDVPNLVSLLGGALDWGPRVAPLRRWLRVLTFGEQAFNSAL